MSERGKTSVNWGWVWGFSSSLGREGCRMRGLEAMGWKEERQGIPPAGVLGTG